MLQDRIRKRYIEFYSMYKKYNKDLKLIASDIELPIEQVKLIAQSDTIALFKKRDSVLDSLYAYLKIVNPSKSNVVQIDFLEEYVRNKDIYTEQDFLKLFSNDNIKIRGLSNKYRKLIKEYFMIFE